MAAEEMKNVSLIEASYDNLLKNSDSAARLPNKRVVIVYPGKVDYKLDLGNNYHGSDKGSPNSNNQPLANHQSKFKRRR